MRSASSCPIGPKYLHAGPGLAVDAAGPGLRPDHRRDPHDVLRPGRHASRARRTSPACCCRSRTATIGIRVDVRPPRRRRRHRRAAARRRRVDRRRVRLRRRRRHGVGLRPRGASTPPPTGGTVPPLHEIRDVAGDELLDDPRRSPVRRRVRRRRPRARCTATRSGADGTLVGDGRYEGRRRTTAQGVADPRQRVPVHPVARRGRPERPAVPAVRVRRGRSTIGELSPLSQGLNVIGDQLYVTSEASAYQFDVPDAPARHRRLRRVRLRPRAVAGAAPGPIGATARAWRRRRRTEGDPMTTLATDAGRTDIPLLDDTIGANLARTVAAHGSREALVARHQGVRWTYDELAERVDRCAKGLLALGLQQGDRVGLWSPNYAEWTLLQYATAEIGVILVNVNPAYRTHELQYALAQSGCRMLFAAPSFKTSDYVDMVEQVQPERAGLERAIFFWEDDWDELVAGAGHVGDDELAARRAALRARRPDQHPVHVGHDGVPEGRHAHPPQHPQQRLLRDPAAGVPARRPAVHPGALLPLLRHGDGQPRLHDARGDDGHPVRRLRPDPRARDGRRPRRARPCTACRRCSSPSSPTRSSTPTTCRACAPA